MSKPLAARIPRFMLAALAAAMSSMVLAEEVCNVQGRAAKLDFTLMDIAGNEVALSAFEGRVILLNFWATWCAPCREEIPWLVELYEQYRERGLEVLGVSVNDPVERIGPFVAALGVSYPVLVGAGRDDFKDNFGLVGFPTSFLIGRDGAICVRHTGIASKEQLEREIRALL